MRDIDANTANHAGNGLQKRKKHLKNQEQQPPAAVTIHAVQGGEWAPAEELKSQVLEAVRDGKSLHIDISGVDHLDASVLQVLLAVETEQKNAGRTLQLRNASPKLRTWFEYAGASVLFADASSA